MQRTKTTLRAPDDVSESCIEGTYYWPEEDEAGRYVIHSTNPNHIALLVRHGYEVIGEVAIVRPATAQGPIDVDELGRAQLAAALAERGLSYPEDATRPELAEIAEGWNAARRRTRFSRASEAAQDAPRAAAATALAATSATAAGGPESGQGGGAADGDLDFAAASYEDLKGWLIAHNIAFPVNTPKKTLREMAERAVEAMRDAA